MDVIVNGHEEKETFVCINCGCIFSATKDEYWYSNYNNVSLHKCNCPECSSVCAMLTSIPDEEDCFE